MLGKTQKKRKKTPDNDWNNLVRDWTLMIMDTRNRVSVATPALPGDG